MLKMKSILCCVLLTMLLICLIQVDKTDAWTWRGHIQSVRRVRYEYGHYCTCWYWWWGCSYYRRYWYSVYYYDTVCQPGWRHNGNHNCNIPVCYPSCEPRGTCEQPNRCKCQSIYSGPGCRTATCSYRRPCYPGTCANSSCSCDVAGFSKTNERDGCTTFNSDPQHQLAPTIGRSNVTISQKRRTDSYVSYMFTMEVDTSTKKEFIWSNQRRFNKLTFHFESLFQQPDNIPQRPLYVHDSKLGVVHGQIMVNHTKHPRDNSRIRDAASNKTHVCDSGFSKDNPALEVTQCNMEDDQYMTSIEHNDWVTVTFQSTSGGFMKLLNTDQNREYTKYFKGLQDIKEVEFRFDFIAPKHCSEPQSFSHCSPNTETSILRVEKEFTKDPIKIYWNGWDDDLSGVLEHYVEIFKLEPDPYGRLVEKHPIDPVKWFLVPENVTSTKDYPQYTPTEPGMYSVLMETRDMANNSRTARRFVLYDSTSEITIKDGSPGDGLLYVPSAVAETGYMWQTKSGDADVPIDVNWKGHFVNEIHENGKLLNEILEYPTQFADIEDDGILSSKKYVSADLDDTEGERNRSMIQNCHGIKKFEIAKIYTNWEGEPAESEWDRLPLAETTSFKAAIGDGSKLSIWIRATDAMGHKAVSNVTVYFDATAPLIAPANNKDGIPHKLEFNVQDGIYNYTSRVKIAASDEQSGVHKLGYTITIHTPNKAPLIIAENTTDANTGTPGNPYCKTVSDKCFLPEQNLDINNCWLTVNKDDLGVSTATVEVTAYNQALLKTFTSFSIPDLTQLKGLEKYSGPTNIRIENLSEFGFRVAWDLPKQKSCYESAEIIIMLVKYVNGEPVTSIHSVNSRSTFFDILMSPNTKYNLTFGIQQPGGTAVDSGFEALTGTTPEKEDDSSGVSIVTIAGAVGGTVVVVGLAIGGVVVLIRKGVIRPQQRAATIKRRVTQKYRQSMAIFEGSSGGGKASPRKKRENAATNDYGFDNRQSELYIYGGMDMAGPQSWCIDRIDVSFEDLMKEGRFAKIYKATLRHGQSQEVVAKTLKTSFTSEDELLMKAKINFAGTAVGEHPNVLKFIGAVVDDQAVGPFIIYEYCALGTLKDYLVSERKNITFELQDNLFRFGRGIAMGMEFLASKGIVHRRLAARNILLTHFKEVKISGFGPQSATDDDGDAEAGKQERIPIKWMAPECHSSTKDATEKSDVWSYGIVLWEIFSMGNTPYDKIRSRDLPSKLKKGERLPKPEQCDDTWYEEMKKCWSYKQDGRPSFTDLRIKMDDMFTTEAGDDYYYCQR